MHALRFVATAFLGLLIVIDTIVAARLLHSGWPKTIVLTASGQAAQVQVLPMHLGVSGSVLVVLYGVLHVGLCYLVWRAWRHAHRANT